MVDFLIDVPVVGMRARDKFEVFVIVEGETGECLGTEDF